MEKKSILLIVISCIFLYSPFSFCYGSSNISAELQQLLDSFRIKAKVPAAVLTVNYPNGALHNFVSGTVENKTEKNPNPAEVTTDHLFQIGSITKSFTAAIILQLEAEKKLSINDTIFHHP